MLRLIAIALMSLLALGCSSTGPAADRFPNVVEITGCVERDRAEPDAWACLHCAWDGEGALEIFHTNTVFNCCPLDYGGKVTVQGDEIAIEEIEGVGQCDCLCPYDILYRIEGLEPGTYDLEVEELYLEPGNEQFDVRLILEEGIPSDREYCLERDGYPFW